MTTGTARATAPNAAAGPPLLPDWWRATLRSVPITLAQLVISGVLVWALQWWLAPDWLVSTRAGLTTTLQVVPAVIVAIYVFLLGSAFVIAEQATSTYSSRAIPLVLLGSDLRHQLMRALLLAVAAVLLSGQVPDSGAPPDAVTAAVATIAIATATLLPLSAVVLAVLFAVHTHPRAFVERVLVRDIERDLQLGLRRLTSFRIDVLGDMLRSALERRDRTSVVAACDGLLQAQRTYLEAIRDQHDPAGALTDEIAAVLDDACDHIDYLRLPSRDRVPVVEALERAKSEAASFGDRRADEEADGQLGDMGIDWDPPPRRFGRSRRSRSRR
ncbi:MAG: hypothetical protein M3340_09355 [Actinomycetota bacterium]|nr:hypothetical protein [Actinomycetota bacterium]